MKGMQAGLKQQESGFAALIIAIVLVLVLSLTTIGFAQLMRNEVRSATDSHLSSQAYYAAESGVNDAVKAINEGYTDTKNTCPAIDPASVTLSTDPRRFLTNSQIGNGISYSCLLIDPQPKTLEYQSVDDAAQTRKFVITGIDPSDSTLQRPVTSIVFGWQDHDGGNTFIDDASGDHKLGTKSSWGDTGVLRVSITPLADGRIGRDTLSNATYIAYFYPNRKASAGAAVTSVAASATGTNAGIIVDGNCNTGNPSADAVRTPRYCNVEVTGLGQINYLIDVRSIYRTSDLSIAAFNNATQLRIQNAQTMIDSTGKAQDILRRIQVRVPSKNSYLHSDYATETTDNICKQLELTPNDTSADNCPADTNP